MTNRLIIKRMNGTIISNPLCSVLLPVFNNKNDIINAINSVKNQSFKDLELIIIDDCSNDGTCDIIKKYIKNNPLFKIKLLINKKNSGTYVSLNEGLKKAKGKYIARIDSDDIMASNMLDEHIRVLESSSHYIASQSKFIREGSIGRYGEISLVYRKEIILKIGYYDSVRFGADSEFLLRLKKVYGTPRIFYINKILYFAKNRMSSLTTSSNTGFRGEGASIRKQYFNSYSKWHKSCRFPFMKYPHINRPFQVNINMMP